MKARAVAHLRVAAGIVGVDGIGGLHEGEGRDDDAPDALHRVERQQAVVALDQRAHHLRLAVGPKGAAAARPGTLRPLDLDQPVDDLAALHQKAVHGEIDAVDLAAQLCERVGRGFGQGVVLHGGLAVWRLS